MTTPPGLPHHFYGTIEAEIGAAVMVYGGEVLLASTIVIDNGEGLAVYTIDVPHMTEGTLLQFVVTETPFFEGAQFVAGASTELNLTLGGVQPRMIPMPLTRVELPEGSHVYVTISMGQHDYVIEGDLHDCAFSPDVLTLDIAGYGAALDIGG